MNPKVLPFILGLALGFGMRWFFHLIYFTLIVASFFTGRYLAH